MEHNVQVRNELLESVSELSNEQLNQKVEEGSWTIMQVLEHLYLMEKVLVQMMRKALVKGPEQPTDEKPIHLTPDRSRKVVAPDYVTPSDAYMTLEEIKQKLHESREGLHAFVAQHKEEELKKKSFPHPVFGLLHLKQWSEFIGYHEKRHLKQIEELKVKL
ncbi:DinB family protein [Metabacillus iocasae]|uniref:Damage-inducible protein DinB n=1 Tax=Priestia iocasae TaxID=2291674 RepID=A0ABS2QZ50_9BACI|nr:putative damage-inducible protein DinB [Metabacillus iocasae]